jgi:hypothetical protein
MPRKLGLVMAPLARLSSKIMMVPVPLTNEIPLTAQVRMSILNLHLGLYCY